MRCCLRRLPIVALLSLAPSVPSAIAGEPVSLFDGKSLDQWDVLTCEAVVEDGAILLKGGNGLVQSKKQYRDFVLQLEWKALKPDNWDSGIYFRYDRVPPGRPWPPRYQVNLRKGLEGDLDGSKTAKNTVPTKAGQWNSFELTVQGDTAALKVNGEPSWTYQGIESPAGFIALQAEIPGGGPFLFRNIRLTEWASKAK